MQKFCKSLGYVDFSRPLSQMGRLRFYTPALTVFDSRKGYQFEHAKRLDDCSMRALAWVIPSALIVDG